MRSKPAYTVGLALLSALLLSVATSCQKPAPATKRKSPPPVIKRAPVPPPAVETRPQLEPGLSEHVIYHEGRERYVLLYKPAGLADGPAPLVLAFHGGGGVPENMVDLSGFNELADRLGFLVAYPSGSGSTPTRLFWNILLSGTYATVNELDDLGFVSNVIDKVSAMAPVDPKRIYAAGFSQGGMLCYRLACDPDLSSRIAAIAVVGATMTVASDDCRGSRPVPLISFHGKQDPFSKFAGGIADKAPRNDLVPRPGVEESILNWVRRGGLPETPSASGASGSAVMQQYGPDARGFQVVSWVFEDGGHTWPGSAGNLPEWMMGKVNKEVDATLLIWDFFKSHPLP